jgi:Uma2 family endonuclease
VPRPRSADEFRRRTDVGRKLQGYRDAGTRELWLVDTPASTVLIYRSVSFGESTEVGSGEQLSSPLLPGFALPIDELLAG